MDEPSISRRQTLTSGLAGALVATAGCLGSQNDSTDSTSTRELELSLSSLGDSLRDSFVDDLAETRLSRDEQAFQALMAGERYTSQGYPPFVSRPDDPVYTRHEGTYYRLDSVVVDEATATYPVLRLFDAEGSTPTGEAVAHADLPEPDQRAVEIAHMAARARGNVGGVPVGLVRRDGYVYRRATEDSELLPDGPDHVRYRDRTYRVEVTREQFHEPVYRPTAEPVAETPDRMEAIVRAQFLEARFDREELSSEGRRILETARAESYAESHPYSAAYRTVLERLGKWYYVDGNVENDGGFDDDGRRMLRYGDTYYDYRLRFVENGSA